MDNNFSTLAIEDQVGWKIKNLLDNLPFTHPCPNFNLEFLKSLFVRLRIFHTIKKLNKSLLSAPRNYSINNMSWKRIPPSSSEYPQSSSGLKPKEQPPKIYVD
ncbi:Transposable element P transposase, partial [Aphis craccivora]